MLSLSLWRGKLRLPDLQLGPNEDSEGARDGGLPGLLGHGFQPRPLWDHLTGAVLCAIFVLMFVCTFLAMQDAIVVDVITDYVPGKLAR